MTLNLNLAEGSEGCSGQGGPEVQRGLPGSGFQCG